MAESWHIVRYALDSNARPSGLLAQASPMPALVVQITHLLYDHAGAPNLLEKLALGRPTGRIEVVITAHSRMLAAAAPVEDLVALTSGH